MQPLPQPLSMNRLKARNNFIQIMSSLVLVDIAITGIYVAVSGRIDVLGSDLLANLLIFGLLNSLGAYLLFSPIQNLIDGKGSLLTAKNRINALPVWATAWAITCTAAYCFVGFSIGIFMPYEIDLSSIPRPVLLGALLWFGFIYALYYGFYIFFAVSDFVNGLKLELTKEGILFAPRGQPLRRKLVCIFVIIAFVPAILIALDLTIFRELRSVQGLSVQQSVFLDLFASAFLVGVTLIFITRNFASPLQELSHAVEKIREGDLSVQVPVVSNDEFGVLADNFNAMTLGLRDREFIKDTFGRYVPNEIVNRLLKHRGVLKPQLKTATILFADIAGFTNICESKVPKTVLKMLNEYFTVATAAMDLYGGVINQFQGDAMLVTFNLPVSDAMHSDNAVRAAMELQRIIAGRTFQGVPLEIRIGIHTGEVIAGSVGSEQRLSYTVHGDAVNLAARLEEMNKKYQTKILLSADTAARLKGSFDLEAVGVVDVRGRTKPVRVYKIDI